MDPRILEIVSTKPQLVVEFPRWMLSEDTESELKCTEGLAIVEIAGRDSIAAALETVKRGKVKALLPTIAYTGTEFGDWRVPIKKAYVLKEGLAKRGIKVFDPIFLGAPKFWWILCGRYSTHLFRRFGFYSPCVGCHLYLHAIRIPLAKKIECGVVIGGERESHEGKIKINQIGVALDVYSSFAEKYGIEFLFPLRQVRSDKEVKSIVGKFWEEGTEQLACVLSKNYLEVDGSIDYCEDDIERFFSEFAIKEAEDGVKRFLSVIKG